MISIWSVTTADTDMIVGGLSFSFAHGIIVLPLHGLHIQYFQVLKNQQRGI